MKEKNGLAIGWINGGEVCPLVAIAVVTGERQVVCRGLPTVLLSTIGWFFECLAAYVCMRGLGVDISLMLTTFIFVFASLAGALSMIPGGLGVAEGSMTGLFVANGIDRGAAVAGTMLIRLVTFWFAILLGLISISLYGSLSRKIEPDNKLV